MSACDVISQSEKEDLLRELTHAYYSGVMEVTVQVAGGTNRTIRYQSMRDMRAALDELRRDLRRPRPFGLASHSRGYR